MNARIYDPALGRFMTPDPYVQDAGFLQAYNRYSYGFNNPLSGIDPSGYGFLDDVFDFVGDTVDAVFDDPGKAIVVGAAARWAGGLIANGLICSATSGFIAGTNGLTTALVTLGGFGDLGL